MSSYSTDDFPPDQITQRQLRRLERMRPSFSHLLNVNTFLGLKLGKFGLSGKRGECS